MTEAPVEYAWSDRFKSGLAAMDTTHQEFVALVCSLARVGPADVDARLDRLARHCSEHFAQERLLMERHAFPAAECHIAEHDAVLASISEVQALPDAAHRTATTQRLARALAEWFEGHLDYLDSALAHWVVRHTHGGTPIVLRRDVAGACPAPQA
jgi:hemerythrin